MGRLGWATILKGTRYHGATFTREQVSDTPARTPRVVLAVASHYSLRF